MNDLLSQFSNNAAVRVIATVFLAMLVQALVYRVIERVVAQAVRAQKHRSKADEAQRSQTLARIFQAASAVVIWTMAVLVILGQLNVNVAALLTGAGLIGIIVGFGAQNAIKDVLAGVFLIIENQYRVGDIVTLLVAGQDISGVVEDISVRITRLRDLDGNVHIIQNGNAMAVTNRSFKHANVNVDLRVSFDADINKVERAINSVGAKLAEDEAWASITVNPIQFLRVDAFEDFGVRVKALGTVAPAKQWDVAGEFRRRIKDEFDKQGISIPYPHMVVRQEK